MKFEAKNIIGKKFEIKSELDSVDVENATAIFVLSTVDIDRHGDVIHQDSWQLDNFLKNPVFLEQHMSWEFPLGKFVEIYTEEDPNRTDGAKRLVGKVKFAVEEYDRAKVAFALVANGFMNAVSVGFIPHDVEYNSDLDAFIMRDCELLEVSLVSVPANPMALAKMMAKAEAKGIDMAPFLEKPVKKTAPDSNPRKKLIEVKDEMVKQSETLEDTDAKTYKRAIHSIHKAIRSLGVQ